MINQIFVLVNSGASIDQTVLRAYCRSISVEVGLPVTLVVVDSPGKQIEALEALEAQSGAVICVDDVEAQRPVLHAARSAANSNIVWVDLDTAARPRDSELAASGIPNIRGRGLEGIRWATRSVIARAATPVIEESYGPLPDQTGDLRLPQTEAELHPIVVLIHGGAWRERWERDLMDSVAVDLTSRGYATWNLEYRRVGPAQGGWPDTFLDVAAGIDAVSRLAQRYPLDTGRVALVGHSSGGQLALWAAARSALPAESPGAGPDLTPTAVVSLAGVLDLIEIGRRGSEEGATMLFMGGLPDEVPERYAIASPFAHLPLGECKQLIAYGTADRVDLVDTNRRYCVRAQELGDDVEELMLPGVDHFQVVDPRSLAWMPIADRIERIFPAPARRDSGFDVVA